jgi:hypothetical protein
MAMEEIVAYPRKMTYAANAQPNRKVLVVVIMPWKAPKIQVRLD